MSENVIAARKRERLKKRLIDAYEAYQRKEPNSLDELMVKVRDLAEVKLGYLEMEFTGFEGVGTATTMDDVAQDVVIGVWQGIENFRGNADNFYAWVHQIIINQGADFFNELKHNKYNRKGLMINLENEDGELEEIENPILYEDDEREKWFRIPHSIQGVELNICKLMMDGKNYAQVAKALSMTEDAVKQRLYRLRKSLDAERAAKRGEVWRGAAAAD